MKKYSAEQITVISTLIATQIAQGRNIEQITAIKNILTQINCSLATIVTQRLADKK